VARLAPLEQTPDAPGQEPAAFVGVESGESVEPAPVIPRHVAIIMDGNRRWARMRGAPEAEGHAAGVEAIRPIVEQAVQRGVEVLSLYAFSRENWARTDAEVVGLFGLLEDAIRSETDELRAQGVQVRLLGRMEELPPVTRASIESALAATAEGGRLVLNIAFNYAGRTELVDAVRSIVRSGMAADDVDEATIAAALYTDGLPDPDLVIRTGGEHRLSNFLIWQSAYAELVTTETLWPDFGPTDLDDALAEYASRTRRFGR
jgi:undecaprenyl diphosphate synthase